MRNTKQRREQILQLLAQEGNVQVSDLVNRFGVSSVTIRTDLGVLEEQGLVRRSHGGAALKGNVPPEQNIHQKDAINTSLKERIGAAAAGLVEAGDNIIIDSGTTTLHMARHLRGQERVTVMTNGLNIAWELADSEGIEVMLTGGRLRKQSLSIQGAQAEACLDNYGFDKLFLGVDGLDLQFGLTTYHEAEASLNQKMVARAKKVIVLSDASKFGRISLHRIAQLDQVDMVITDAGIDAAYAEGLQKLGIEVIVTS